MNRRDFLKAFGATSATVAASTALISLPESVPAIALLEPKKIVTSLNEDVMPITGVLSYQKSWERNPHITQDFHIHYGQHVVRLDIEIYSEGMHFPLIEKVTFPMEEELHGETYQIINSTVTAVVGQSSTVSLSAYRIADDGRLSLG